MTRWELWRLDGHRITAGPGASLPCSAGGWVAWLEGKAGAWGHMSALQLWLQQEKADLSGPREDFPECRPGIVGEACLGAAYLRRLLTKGYSKSHWIQTLSSQPAWSPGHIDSARLPGWEEPAVQRPPSLGHRMPPEPDPPGSGPRRPGAFAQVAAPAHLPAAHGAWQQRGSLGDFLSRQSCWPGLVEGR